MAEGLLELYMIDFNIAVKESQRALSKNMAWRYITWRYITNVSPGGCGCLASRRWPPRMRLPLHGSLTMHSVCCADSYHSRRGRDLLCKTSIDYDLTTVVLQFGHKIPVLWRIHCNCADLWRCLHGAARQVNTNLGARYPPTPPNMVQS